MKAKLDAGNLLYPMPTTIVGALVNNKPNFITIAHVGILTVGDPELISLGMSKTHYSNQGIKEQKAFSVNIPSQALMKETDYVGMFSGKKHDKSEIFEVFYGELKNAPMAGQCPINMECRLHDVYDTRTHDIFIGAIVATHVDETILKDGKVDISRVGPLLFDMSTRSYWSLGERIGKAWSVGKELKTPAK